MEQPDEPGLLVLPPEQALAAARPLPSRDRLVIEDVTDEEWATFFAALTEFGSDKVPPCPGQDLGL